MSSAFEKISETSNGEKQSVQTVPSQPVRKCAFCRLHVADKKSFFWETMEFCSEECLRRYYVQHGSFCSFCHGLVQTPNMGKYAVRIGFEVLQFCSGPCLEEFKKKKKLCRYCQADVTNNDSFISIPVDKKGTVREFCSKSCVDNYNLMGSGSKIPPLNLHDFCAVCASKKQIEIQVIYNSDLTSLCSYVCFRTFRFAHYIVDINHCTVCKKFFPPDLPDSFFLPYDGILNNFCSKICHNTFLTIKRKLMFCSCCKVRKFNFDMIKAPIRGGYVTVCSLNCLTLYQVSLKASHNRKLKCDLCSNFALDQFNLILSDTTTGHFCSYKCVATFRAQYFKTPLILPAVNEPSSTVQNPSSMTETSFFSSVSSTTESRVSVNVCSTTNTDKKILTQIKKCTPQIILKPSEPKQNANKFVQCKPCAIDEECQTDEFLKYPSFLPIPFPIYVPFPIMHNIPIPVPVPIIQPYPVPVLIPTPEKTYQRIMYQKEITATNSNESNVKLKKASTFAEENEFETISSESNNDIDSGASVEFGTFNQDNGRKIRQTKKLVFNEDFDKIKQTKKKSENKRTSQDPVVKLKTEPASNIRVTVPQVPIKDDGGKVIQTDKLVINETHGEILQTKKKTENKRPRQDSVVKLKTEPASNIRVTVSQVPIKDEGGNIHQTKKLVFNEDFDKIEQTKQKPENERTGQDPVVKLKTELASNIRVTVPQVPIKDDGEKVLQTEKLGFNETHGEILQTKKKTENKRSRQDSVVKLKTEPASNMRVTVPEVPIKDDSRKILQTKKLGFNETHDKTLQTKKKAENKRPRQDPVVSLKTKPASNIRVAIPLALINGYGKMTLGNSDLEKCPVTQINGWPKRPSHIVRVDTNAPVGASDDIGKILHTKQKTENKRVSQDPVVKLKATSASNVIIPQIQIEEKAVSSKISEAHGEELLQRKRTSELTARSSSSKRIRLAHVTHIRPENDEIIVIDSPPSDNVSPSSLREMKQSNANPSVPLKVSEALSVWNRWLAAKNILACLANKKPKLFGTNILKLTIDELNYLLCKFVKEIRQQNGAEYAADSVYYFCLRIQQYLFLNGSINNIFLNDLYQPFINALDEVARKFSGFKSTSQSSSNPGVEEELLWECDQLGGQSPYVLLATILFFNTKLFKLLTVREHMQISFSNIVRMKKQNSKTSFSSDRTVVLRFYPPSSALGVRKSQKETFYQVHENKENVLRCPVRLYEFYLSKCHDSVKQRSDVFYMQPEGSCLLDSRVWFCPKPLPKDILAKMLHRIRMVKEINI